MALWGEDLEDKLNILKFLQRVDAAEAWIQEKVRPCWVGTELAVGLADGVRSPAGSLPSHRLPSARCP